MAKRLKWMEEASRIAAEAKAHGMTYGKYVQMMEIEAAKGEGKRDNKRKRTGEPG